MTDKKETCVTTVAFVGLPNAGKSTLLNALVGTKIAPTTRKPQTTRRCIRGIKTFDRCQQIYFDTPGMVKDIRGLDRFMLDQVFSAIKDVDQVVAVIDSGAPLSKNEKFLQKIFSLTKANNQPFIIAINKIDALKSKALCLELIRHYQQGLGVSKIVPISALKHDGLKELFFELRKEAKPGEFLFSEELFTDASEKEIVAELIREKAMLELEEELPYRIAVTIEFFDESRRESSKKPLVAIDAVLHVERQSQKAIVIGKGGQTLRKIGVRARKEIEHLLQCQVMLKLFVRVEPNWTTSPKALKKLGY